MPRMMIGAAVAGVLALAGTVSPGYAVEDDWQHDWTVLTLASDGAWGAATDGSINRAIASAIRDCQAMSTRSRDCGSKLSTIRAGWSVALLCGDETIIAAARQRAEAERKAIDRETELRLIHRRDMPPCMRVVTVNPHGVVGTPYVQAADRR